MPSFLKIGYNSIPRLSTSQDVVNYRDQIFSDLAAYTNSKLAYFPKLSVETVDANNGISNITDLSPSGIPGTQATSNNRPTLSRADNQENRLLYSADATNAAWDKASYPCSVSGTTITATASTNRHGIAQTLKNSAQGGSSWKSIVEIAYNNYQYAVIGDVNDATWHVVVVDLVNGTLGTQTNCTASIITIAPGRFRITINWTHTDVTLSQIGITFGTALNNTSVPSWTPSGTEKIDFYFASGAISTADNTYIATTTALQYAGVNNNPVMIFDGVSDSLDVAYSPLISTGFTIAAFFEAATLQTTGLLASYNGGGASRFEVLIHVTGYIVVYVMNGATNYIGRRTATGVYAAGDRKTISVVYDGTTSASGIKIYVNGSQVDITNDNGGAYTVPGSGASNIQVGAIASGNYFNGKIGFVSFQNSALTLPQIQEQEAFINYNLKADTRTFVLQGAASDISPIGNVFLGGSTVYWQNSATVVTAKSLFKLGLSSSVAAQAINYIALRGLNLMFKAGSGNITVKVLGSVDNFVNNSVTLLSTTISESQLRGPFLEDYIFEGSLSLAYQYFRIEVSTQYECVHRIRKIYIGTLFDFSGKSPYYPFTPGYGDNGSPFTSDAGSVFKTSSGRRARQLQFAWRGITDADRVFFDKNINQYLTDYPIFLYEPSVSDHKPLNDDGLVFGWASAEVGTKDWKNNNQIALTLREDIVG